MQEVENQTWEQELAQKTHELFAQRLNPLQSDLARIKETLATLEASMQTSTTAESLAEAGITEKIKQLMEAEVAKALQTEQANAADTLERVKAELTTDFETRLASELEAAKSQSATLIAQLETSLASATAVAGDSSMAGTPAAQADYSGFKAAIEELNLQRTQSETLTVLLQRAAQFAPRLAFFVVRGAEAVGWKMVGFDNGLNEENVRSLAVSLQAQSLLGQAIQTQTTAIQLSPSQAEVATVLGRFAHPVPQGAIAVPLVVRGKAAAVLYADSGSETDSAIQLEAIESLTYIASLVIELLPVRRNVGVTIQPGGQAFTANSPSQAPQTAQVAPAVPAPVVPPQPTTEPPSPATGNIALVAESVPVVADGETARKVDFDRPSELASPLFGNPAMSLMVGAALPTPVLPEPDALPIEPESEVTSELVDTVIEAVETPVAAVEGVIAQPVAEDVASTPSFDTAELVAEKVAVQTDSVPATAQPVIEAIETPVASIEEEADRHFEQLREKAKTGDLTPPPAHVHEAFNPRTVESLPSLSLPPSDSPAVSTELPIWMQRLQDQGKVSIPPAFPPAQGPAPTANNWQSVEEAFSTAPIIPLEEPVEPPPPPPAPPPMRLPSLAKWATVEAEQPAAPTEDRVRENQLPVANPALAKSIPHFSQPSEPPRYAAPSLSVSTAASETEVRAHNDARRFARLLVSEIKLYNAAKVNEGRRSGDLYNRLREEIDRSRKVYDKRVSPAVATKFDYFYDELVQTLAEGDPSKLGEACPGPMVSA